MGDIMTPAQVLLYDSCPLGLPEILTAAYMARISENKLSYHFHAYGPRAVRIYLVTLLINEVWVPLVESS